ncbi:MAG: HAD hydrolase-like protein [Thermoguttaceae bacterium]|nr:HAD hydrolase-like protein [Thermoguttaceae bacterium]
MIKALVFDFDGTIADTLPVCNNAFRKTVEPVVGHELTPDELRSYFGPTEEGIFEKFFPERQQELCELYLKFYAELQNEVPDPVPGVMELIHDVKNEGVHVSLVTAKGRRSCDISLNFYGIADVFEEIRYGGSGGRVKDAAIIELLDKQGIAREDCVYVGDSPKDVVSAHKAGVPCWSVAWLPTAKAELDMLLANAPEKVFYTVDEMRRELEKEGILK